MAMAMLSAISTNFPLLLPYGATCLAAHLILYLLFRHLLPSKRDAGPHDEYPWKADASLTAHRLVALGAMGHWCALGFRHLRTHDYHAEPGGTSASELAALAFVPTGFEMAQRAMGALLLWDVPSSLVGGSGPPDMLMHLHHAGMLVVIVCVLGLAPGSSRGDVGGVGTHLAPIFLGVIELSSIPLQIVDLFHPKKSPHWYRFARDSNGAFARLCAAANEAARNVFALLFLVVRGVYFPYAIAAIAVPDLYAEGSGPALVLLVMCVLFTLLQLYWAALVLGQVKQVLFGSAKGGTDGKVHKDE